MSNEFYHGREPLLRRVQRVWRGNLGTGASAPNGLLPLNYFLDCLVKERARSDRSGESFSLVVFTVEGAQPVTSAERAFEALAHALAQRTRVCDTKGWYNNGVGLILPNTASELVPDIVYPIIEHTCDRMRLQGLAGPAQPRLRYDYYAYPTKSQTRMRQQPTNPRESNALSQAEECER